jgi:YD repeat-containing protein
MEEKAFLKKCLHCGADCSIGAAACYRCNARFGEGERRATPTLGRMLAIALVMILVALTAGVSVMVTRLTSNGAYKEALAIAQSSAELKTTLGDGIRFKFPIIGFTFSDYNSEFTEFAATLAGTRGRGRLYAAANLVNGRWKFSRLSFVGENSPGKVNLAPLPHLLALPTVPAKKIYLLPLALDKDQSLQWAPAYYRAKLGVEVEVLADLPFRNELVDPVRHQLDAEKCLEYLRELRPELAQDPFAITILVTSKDMFIDSFGWAYAENYRHADRAALVSSARLRPPPLMANWNPEWLNSRLEKMLTKNIAMLYFDLPMSSDYTSLLSGGVLSGREVDFMAGEIIGAERRWDPFIESGDPEVTIYDVPGKPILWRAEQTFDALPDMNSQMFMADLAVGLFVQRKTDFHLDGDGFPIHLTRAYNSLDERPRAFGIGTSHSLDIFLIGEMGVYVDLIFEDGARIHFRHFSPEPGQVGDYAAEPAAGNPFSKSIAAYVGDRWVIRRKDGWKFYFPYRPKALPSNVTILTGFEDPSGHVYKMERDAFGALLSVTTPAGRWLRSEPDANHRIQRISDSSGRIVKYEYDSLGRLSRVIDSNGKVESYTYNDKAQMLTAAHGKDEIVITNVYDVGGKIERQTMADGREFEYHYVRDSSARGNVTIPDLISYPNGLQTNLRYSAAGYMQSLPSPPPQ